MYFLDYAITVVPFFPPLYSPQPSSIPTPLVHIHGLYIQVLWLLHFLSCSSPPLVYFVPTNYTSYSLYHFSRSSPHSLRPDNPPCDLHFCDSVPVLVVAQFLFSFFRFSWQLGICCHFYCSYFLFFSQISSFSISYNKGLMIMNSFNLTLSGKYFICPSILNDSFAG